MDAALLEAVLKQISSGAKRIEIGGLSGSSKAYLLSRLIQEGPKRTYLFLAASGKEAVRFERDLRFYLGPFAEGEVYFFPPHDVLPFAHLSPHNDISCDRMRTLFALTRNPPPAAVVTTVAATLSLLPPKEALAHPLTLKVGEEQDRDLFLKTVTEWGYQGVPLVIDRGNFAVRGSLVDLFSPIDPHPLRIEWAGDRVESIRSFDPKTQRSIIAGEDTALHPAPPSEFHRSTVHFGRGPSSAHYPESTQEAVIIPVREVLLNEETAETFARKARQSAEEQGFPRSLWAPLIEKAREGIPFAGIETCLPLFYEHPTDFWDWLPPETIAITENSWSRIIEEHFQEIRTLTEGKDLLLQPEEILLSAERFKKRSEERPLLSFPPFFNPDAISFETETHEGIRREIEQAKRGLEPLAPLARRLRQWLQTDSVLLVASSESQAQRITDLLAPYFPQPLSLSKTPFAERKQNRGELQLLIGELSAGFRLPSEKITIVTEEEIFGQKVRKRAKDSFTESGLSSFAELKLGDPIVHKEHGIGIYRGLIPMTIDGIQNDFLLIEYRDGDKLYLPIYRMNLVQRYTGGDGKPRIDRLGGNAWIKLRGKAEKAIRELAGELLNLYAARTAGAGFAFSPPNDLFEAFEASFPYEETPDQERAIAEVLEEMQKGKPMDRLVLGDVGYGKTEVALRAAFKAVLDGKQAAFLVPTTLLAFQHHERFLERFKDYPVRIEMLSRFRSSAEQKRIVREAVEGKIDILIGTHRLLQPDISFKDLGLLIIDEEHRFGVEHKEKVKRLRKNIDVLALSATPIPRTLYMSLVGVRGISVIETPPTDRLAIRTYVMPFEEAVIHEAILRELKRGGQIFFVHNEIETIGSMKEFLHKLVPEAAIEIGHGQMEEKKLEEIMIRFFHQEFNLLLCTTIIESGIDIPTANTILINQAEHFGLAQVYQLRGRVGRGSHRAYAYLLISDEQKLTPEAKQRLAVLQRFSELGSGYKMASYDLEIRGAGNLLGTAQSGHMAAIGYELYTDLLEKAVRELKGEKVLEEIDPELHFRIPAFLPEDYLPDPPVRLELYRRLSALDREEEIDPIEDELRDRFGSPPPEVENLLELSAIKTHAKRLRIKQIRYDGKRFVYAFDPSSPLPPDLLLERIKKDPKHCRFTPDHRFIVDKPLPKENLALAEAKKFLRELTLHL